MPMPIEFLALIAKVARLRDEAARAVALVPAINAAIAKPTIPEKLEAFAPISSEVILILASGLKDLDVTSYGSSDPVDAASYDGFLAQECAASGVDYGGVKEFFAKLKELAKELQPYIVLLLPLFLDQE